MKVLLTGGTGYIGSNVAAALLESGYQVVLADNFVNSTPQVADYIEKSTGKSVVLHHVDITDFNALCKVFENHSFDAVMHFAAFKSVSESINSPVGYYDNNLNGLIVLLKAMQKFDVKKLIYSSSASVYGVGNPSPFSETIPLGIPTNPYGWTKWMSEQILRDTAQADSTLSILLLRYFNPIGGHKSGLLGDHPKSSSGNLMSHIIQTAQGRQKRLHIYGNDYPTADGTCIRDYIHVTDVAEGHIAALNYCANAVGIDTINLGTGYGISVLELIKAFEKTNHIDVPYVFRERRIGDVAECWAAVEKAKRVLSWQATKTLSDMCRDSWRSRI